MRKQYYFSDIETSKFLNPNESDLDFDSLEFKLGCFIQVDISNDTIIEKYHSINQLEYVKSLIKPILNVQKIVYFHNLSFDSKFLIDFMYDSGWFDNVKIIKSGSKILQILCYKRIKNRNQIVLKIKDSLALLLVNLRDLGKMVGLSKLEFDFDYSNEKQLEKAIEYCYVDCQIIYEALKYVSNSLRELFHYDLTIDKLPLTIASLGKKLFKLFYPEVYYQYDTYIEKYLRKYYFGGRTEVLDFNKLKSGCYYDINSEYPYVLSKYQFAYGKVYRYETNLSLSKLYEYDNILAFECIINEQQHYPLYPVRQSSGNVIFANGKKEVLISKSEMNYLINEKLLGNEIKLIKINAVYSNDKHVNFNLFFSELYKFRKSFPSTHFYNYFIKIVMNSTYGKFGQKAERENKELVYNWKYTDEIYEYDGIFVKNTKYIQKYQEINLLNAVLTTNYGRFVLWEKIRFCHKAGIDVYYCDTDSIVISNSNLEILKEFTGNELGNWQIENEFIEFQAIDSKEYYFISEAYNQNIGKLEKVFKSKFKGVNTKNWKKKEFIEHYKTGTKNLIIPTFLYCMKRKNDSDMRNTYVLRKQKRNYYTKRKIFPDFTTAPVNLDDNEYKLRLENKNRIENILYGLS